MQKLFRKRMQFLREQLWLGSYFSRASPYSLPIGYKSSLSTIIYVFLINNVQDIIQYQQKKDYAKYIKYTLTYMKQSYIIPKYCNFSQPLNYLLINLLIFVIVTNYTFPQILCSKPGGKYVLTFSTTGILQKYKHNVIIFQTSFLIKLLYIQLFSSKTATRCHQHHRQYSADVKH